LSTILGAPTLSDSDKSQIVAELEKHTGGADKSGTVKNLLAALAENNRLGLLEGVADKFATLIGAARGEVELTITSATVWNISPSASLGGNPSSVRKSWLTL
jgi:F-type H+-transporting ATPase subunit O